MALNCILLSLYVLCNWALSFWNRYPGFFSLLGTTSLYDCITVFPFFCCWILNCIFLWNRKRQCCYEHSFIWLLVHIAKTGCIPWIELLCGTVKHIINRYVLQSHGTSSHFHWYPRIFSTLDPAHIQDHWNQVFVKPKNITWYLIAVSFCTYLITNRLNVFYYGNS